MPPRQDTWDSCPDIVLSSRIFFLPTVYESVFVVIAADRASLVRPGRWWWGARKGFVAPLTPRLLSLWVVDRLGHLGEDMGHMTSPVL